MGIEKKARRFHSYPLPAVLSCLEEKRADVSDSLSRRETRRARIADIGGRSYPVGNKGSA